MRKSIKTSFLRKAHIFLSIPLSTNWFLISFGLDCSQKALLVLLFKVVVPVKPSLSALAFAFAFGVALGAAFGEALGAAFGAG